jgi:hypothetical protein
MTARRPPFNSGAVFSFNGTIRAGRTHRAIDGVTPEGSAWRSMRAGVRCGHRHGAEGEARACLEQRRRIVE